MKHPAIVFGWALLGVALFGGVLTAIFTFGESGRLRSNDGLALALVFGLLVFPATVAAGQQSLLRKISRFVQPDALQVLSYSEHWVLGLRLTPLTYAFFFDDVTYVSVERPMFVHDAVPRFTFDEARLVATFNIKDRQGLQHVQIGRRSGTLQIKKLEPEVIDVFALEQGAALVFLKNAETLEAIPFCRLMPTVEAAMTEAAKFGTRVESDQ